MSEDTDRRRRRQYLEKQKEKVMQAQDWLNAENGTAEETGDPMDFEPEIKAQPADDW